MSAYHIAQINIARMLAPLDDPIMHGFVSNLDRINALAEATPGFVWRLKGDEGNATASRIFEDDYIIINMSVWESIDALFDYTYKSAHVEIFRQRRDWFKAMKDVYFALWWIPAGHTPTPQEARARLEHLREHGATPHAFTFKKRFEPQMEA